MNETMTGGEAMIRAAINNGITSVFGLPGVQIYPLFEAVRSHGLELFVPRHEQTAAYMAMGYAKSSGRPAAFCVVPGPGVLNTAAALCTAFGNCSPIVCLTGQVPSEFLGRGRGHLHELPDQAGTLGTFIKQAVRIDDSRETATVMNEAFRTALGGRPGPVAVEMCWDTMAAAAEITVAAPTRSIEAPEPDLDVIAAAARRIEAARRPMIMCGAGAQHASEEVLALADLIGAPVTAFRSGRGVVAEDHRLGVNPVAARELWDDVDLLIGIGSRLEMPYYRWGDPMHYERMPSSGPALIRIDIDPLEMDRFVPDIGIVADAKAGTRLLCDAVKPTAHADRNAAAIAAAKALAERLFERIQPHAAYLQVIRDVLPRDGFLVPELSQTGFTTYTGAYAVLGPRTYVTEGHQGTLGFGFPTALGVRVAHPRRPVVSIAGDGGFMFAAQELGTAAQYGIGLVTIVFNNGAYANVLRDQKTQFGGAAGATFLNPDFRILAESFGVASHRVATPAALKPALETSLAAGRPALIEVVVDPERESSPWPLIHMRKRPSQLTL